jgi:hypothetical protein
VEASQGTGSISAATTSSMFLLARLLGLKQRLNAFGVDKADADDLDRPGRAEAVDARGESDAAAVRAKRRQRDYQTAYR